MVIGGEGTGIFRALDWGNKSSPVLILDEIQSQTMLQALGDLLGRLSLASPQWKHRLLNDSFFKAFFKDLFFKFLTPKPTKWPLYLKSYLLKGFYSSHFDTVPLSLSLPTCLLSSPPACTHRQGELHRQLVCIAHDVNVMMPNQRGFNACLLSAALGRPQALPHPSRDPTGSALRVRYCLF